jgi:hypothetical protein
MTGYDSDRWTSSFNKTVTQDSSSVFNEANSAESHVSVPVLSLYNHLVNAI